MMSYASIRNIVRQREGHKLGEWITEKEPTCTVDGSKYKLCTVCGEKVVTEPIEANGHKESEWVIDSNPTCTEDGLKHKECSVCGEKNYRTPKNKRNTPDRIELNKYCPRCQKHTAHKEEK